ncbi:MULTISPECIES: DNA-processing protein DprA [unclassified Frankia]|uniref:DNA-processing protein DprA n=1 Tax=unclassified Frankia TaxID=2632575 RepID=UPI002AD2C099|nr:MULTISPECIES: DNA-processing protein DprA [unclassified Frankia]
MAEPSIEEQAELVALLRERPRGLTWLQLAGAVLENGSVAAARAQLVAESLFGDDDHATLLNEARGEVRGWHAAGMEFLSIVDERYPARVRDIHEAPPFLFARGRLLADDRAVSVVGSRNASERGLQMARSIADALVSMDLTVVAGLAAGIDTAAHETTLARGGRTVAVIGTGINRCYPAANRGLQERITKAGLLLSQFWPDAPPQRHNFPMRNAVMSGFGITTIVVEAGEHSGARVQARMAVHHGRPVILTDLVVNSTEWGRELVSRPDVYVASSITEVRAVVEKLAERPSQLEAVLSQITV